MNIKFSARAGTIFINGTTPALVVSVVQGNTRCTTLLSPFHASQMIREFSSQLGRHNANAISFDFPVIKTHSEMLTALTTLKTRIRNHLHSI
jgi:hypothetical protein